MSDQEGTLPQKLYPPGALDFDGLSKLMPRYARLMGLDLGDKTIGLAISDVERRIASSLRTIRRAKFLADAQDLLKEAARFEIGAFVLGLPLNMDGSSGPRVQATRAFARNLHALTPIPILFWDERMSTMAAERVLISADLSRKKRAAVIDSTAAAFILQGALDRLRQIEAPDDQR